MEKIELLGLVAGILTTLAYLPQVARTWRTGSADDLSLPTLMMLVAGIALWTIYGVVQDAPSVWIANGITMVLAASILGMKLRRPARTWAGSGRTALRSWRNMP